METSNRGGALTITPSIRSVAVIVKLCIEDGSVTEKLTFFVAEYSAATRTGAGGGLAHEGEDIEVLEMPLAEALAMAKDGRICDAKTIMLLQYAALNKLMG